MKKFYMLL